MDPSQTFILSIVSTVPAERLLPRPRVRRQAPTPTKSKHSGDTQGPNIPCPENLSPFPSPRESRQTQTQTLLQKPLDSRRLPGSDSHLPLRLPLGLPRSRDASCNADQPGPSGMQAGPDLNWMESGQALTFIGHQVGPAC